MVSVSEAGAKKRWRVDPQFFEALPAIKRNGLPKYAVEPATEFDVAQDYGDEFDEDGGVNNSVAIRPREAARIARSAYPGMRVLKVLLLSSRKYAVTLRGQGRLTRVLVDAENGEIQ